MPYYQHTAPLRTGLLLRWEFVLRRVEDEAAHDGARCPLCKWSPSEREHDPDCLLAETLEQMQGEMIKRRRTGPDPGIDEFAILGMPRDEYEAMMAEQQKRWEARNDRT